MAAFRPIQPFAQFFLPNGEMNAGGFLHFYETDLSTEKNTYSDPDLAPGHLNPNPVPLNSSGVPDMDIWGDGSFGIMVKAANGATISTRNNVRSDAFGAQSIPALVANYFLSNNGTSLLWRDIENQLLPDMTGFANYLLSTDGEVPVWIPPENLNIPTIEVGTSGNYFQIGDVLIQFGHDSFPAATVFPFHASSKSIDFPNEFDTCNGVLGICNKIGIVSNGDSGIVSATYTNTGASFNVDINSEATDSSRYITAPVPFTWFAFGVKEAT